jgi:hypothetical protein
MLSTQHAAVATRLKKACRKLELQESTTFSYAFPYVNGVLALQRSLNPLGATP